MITLGLDIGSLTAKGVLLKEGQMLEKHLIPVGYNSKKAALILMENRRHRLWTQQH